MRHDFQQGCRVWTGSLFFCLVAACGLGLLVGCAPSVSESESDSPLPSPGASDATLLRLSWIADTDREGQGRVVTEGWSLQAGQWLSNAVHAAKDLTPVLALHVNSGEPVLDPSLPSVLGRHHFDGRRLILQPEFPLQPGMAYRAVLNVAGLPGVPTGQPKVTMSRIVVPSKELSPSTLVTQVYPSASVLPENLLKFYIHFSAPMSRGFVYEHIQLLDADGTTIELPFLELDEELWDPNLTRLTVLFDPGRIKRGVKPLEDIGGAIVSGRQYTLVIDAEWRDGRNVPLKEPFRKSFRVGPPDRQQPDLASWIIAAPRAGSRDPLTIQFPEPMDHALAGRMIWVQAADPTGALIPGENRLSDQEQHWHFIPDQPWSQGNFRIGADTTLEDLAGNSLGRPFEVDETKERPKEAPKVVTRLFEID